MIYRKLKKADLDISLAAFGAMRWNSEEACYDIMNRGMDRGMNYVDTSTGYIGGQSLTWTGRAVKHRRHDILLSCKSDWNAAPAADSVRQSIESALKKAELEYFDFYQLWGLQRKEVLDAALKKGGTIEGIHKAMSDGLVKVGPGFTFHGSHDLFKAAVDSDVFLCATVSYNVMNRKEEPLLEYATRNGMAAMVMNPLAGGVLGLAEAEHLRFLWENGGGPWFGSLRFLFANANITTALLGMSLPDQLDKNLSALDGLDALDDAYRRDLASRMDRIKQREGELCTECGYCQVCEHDFDPRRLMAAMRDYTLYGVREENLRSWLTARYVHKVPEDEFAKCVECGECQKKCPQKLPIVDEIRKAKRAFGV